MELHRIKLNSPNRKQKLWDTFNYISPLFSLDGGRPARSQKEFLNKIIGQVAYQIKGTYFKLNAMPQTGIDKLYSKQNGGRVKITFKSMEKF